MLRRTAMLFTSAFAAVAISALSACGGSDHPPAVVAPTKDIVQIASETSSLSILVEAVVAADLATTLKSAGPFTVFAPTDAAFAALLTELKVTKAELLANKTLLKKVLTYHVLSGKVESTQITNGQVANTVQGQALTLAVTNGAVSIRDGRARTANVTTANVLATNGVVHIIDKVILPQQDIAEVAIGNPDFSILVEALAAADLVTTVQSAGPFTVFAPTNAAFAALLSELNVTKAALFANKPLLAKVLTYHVLSGKVLASGITNGLVATTVQGEKFTLNIAAGKVTITDAAGRVANVTATDIAAANGVVHVIDKVILPAGIVPPAPTLDVVGIASGNPDFSILVEAVVAADLVNTLKGTGPFTVFAPTNVAFANLLTELNVTKAALLANKPLLAKVLTYHVLGAKVPSTAITNGLVATSVQGEKFTLNLAAGKVTITDAAGRVANVTATDIAATNGVVHVLDRVILPAGIAPPAPTLDIVGVASGNPDFSILVEAVVAADLVNTLKGTGPFTVFAPTNAAFAALLTELNVTKAELLANKPLLGKVLTYHVLSGKVGSSAITDGLAPTTVQGSKFTLNIAAGKVTIKDANNRVANVVATDIAATNGVVHVIDKVILPL
jgi:uncharacterized surface protein with fasciclin (FAS1) repeats